MASPFPSLEGKYEILEKVHEGGMGAIYKVRHRLLDEIRVIKVMQPQHESDEKLRARFLREAQVVVKLRHPNIAQMYDFAIDDTGRAFIVMEYIDGISLQELLERIGPPPIGLTLELARQSLSALGFLHKKGIIHRDISPDNLMAMRDEDGKPLVKMIDLGIAKVLASKGLTVTGTFLGKLRYASPEQFGAEEIPVDQRSDIYSFGIVLYEMFTGKHPIPGNSPQELITAHLLKPPTDFDRTDPAGRVPPELREIVLKAMAKKPEERFPTADALAQALTEQQGKFAVTSDEFVRALTLPSAPTQRIRIPVAGSTQNKIDEQFRIGATPAPGSPSAADGAAGTAPTLMFPGGSAAGGVVPQSHPGTTPPPAAAPTTAPPSEEVLAAAHRITAAIAAGDLDDALKQIAEAVAAHGERPEFARLRQLVDAAHQKDLATQVVGPAGGSPAPATSGGTAPGTDAAAHPTVVQAPTQVAAAPPVPATAGAKPKPRPQAARKLPIPAIAAGAGVVVLVGAVFLVKGLLKSSPDKAAAVVPPPATQSTPAPQPTAARGESAKLQAAESALATGKLDQLGAALDALTPADIASLSPADQARLRDLRTLSTAHRHDAATSGLDRAIASGDLEQLRGALAGLSKDQRAAMQATPEGKEQLSLAERAVELNATMVRSNHEKNYLAAVQNATDLLELLPAATQARQTRESAADALEAEGEALVKKGQSDTAISRFEALAKVWPDRPGLDKHIAHARAEREVDQKMSAVLAAATASEQEKRPEKGLDALQQAGPAGRWEPQFAQERGRLQRQLAQLDKEPPVVQLKPGFKLEYSKGKPFTILLQVTDDHAVKSVSVLARVEDTTSYQALAVAQAGGSDFTCELTPEFHRNKTVDLYVVATDYAGHTAKLGDADRPLKLKHKWSLF
ncbi:MAG TPA: protein kinase [Thermoanaerobaculaceae bacterium]|nr:protein kinase [Thermoanaerobaculaceae bacterium]